MKKLLWTCAVVAAAGAAWPAPGPVILAAPVAVVILPAGTEYLYVTNRGASNDVTVWNNYVSPPSPPTKQIQDPSLQGPYGIIADSARRLLYVSNSVGPGSISIISGDTQSVVGVIPVPNGHLLKGMAMSDDGAFLYVAGQMNLAPPNDVAAVFEIDLSAKTVFVAGQAGVSGDSAEDCVVIPASVAGGSGNGPGRIYFSVRGTPGFIGVIYFVGSGSPSISMLANILDPTRMSRSPDGKVVFVGCSANDTQLRLMRIDASANTASQLVIAPGATGPWISLDVTFRPETAPQRAYVLGTIMPGSTSIYEVDDTGFVNLNATGPTSGSVSNPMTLRHHKDAFGNDLVFDGPSGATSGDVYWGVYDASLTPGGGISFSTDGFGSPGVGEGPTYFAFMSAPAAPIISDCCPKGSLDVAGATITLKGSGFTPQTQVLLSTASAPLAVSTTFVDANTLFAMVGGVGLGGLLIHDVIVQNPDGQQTFLSGFYQCITPPAGVNPFTVTLPGVSTGYELKSFPQYATVDDLRLSLESQIGPYNPVFYRVFFWLKDRYMELDQLTAADDPCDLSGTGFFVLTRFGQDVTLSAPDVFLSTPGQRVVVLSPGWNMISQPFVTRTNVMPWANIMVSTTGDLAVQTPTISFPQISPLPYERVSDQYVNVNQLTAGRGYWVFNYFNGPIYLIFDSGAVLKPGSPPATYTSMAAGDPGPPLPPSAIASAGGSSGRSRSCGLLGFEIAFLALGRLAALRVCRRRTVA